MAQNYIGRAGPIRKKRPFTVRSATKEDLARLEKPRAKAQIKRLRNSHHMIARLAAAGLNNIEVADRVGYTRERVGQLLASPAMQELVAQYRNRIDERYDVQVDAYFALATQNMIAAERHLSDRIAELDENGELLSVREALAVSRDAADRFGYGKKETRLNVNVDFAARLESAIKRSDQALTAPASERGPVTQPPTVPVPGPTVSPAQALKPLPPLRVPPKQTQRVEPVQEPFRRRA